MKILKINLIIFSILFITCNKLQANTPHPEPRPHTLLDIQENLQKKKIQQEKQVQEEVQKPAAVPEQPPTIPAIVPVQQNLAPQGQAPEMILEITRPVEPKKPEKPVKNIPKVQKIVKPKEEKPKKQIEAKKEEPKKEKIEAKKELSKEAKTYNNPVYVSIVEKSLKTVMEDNLENAHANLREVKRYWMNEAKLHPELKKEIDTFQELNNSFIAYLNAMYMLDRMKDPNYYKAKKFYDYALSEATNVLLEFREHQADLKIALEDYIQDIEMELASVNDIIEPR
ncbi:MAG: hypothetical protein HRT47_08335 [Candidatus Caenarcaniphilales bacterium]|nr:hypothetical protein [Candidatus Caenarcaniphilales bacterium]